MGSSKITEKILVLRHHLQLDVGITVLVYTVTVLDLLAAKIKKLGQTNLPPRFSPRVLCQKWLSATFHNLPIFLVRFSFVFAPSQ
jgi:hypothetical protein